MAKVKDSLLKLGRHLGQNEAKIREFHSRCFIGAIVKPAAQEVSYTK